MVVRVRPWIRHGRIVAAVRVLMVFVVHVGMFVFHQLVVVHVLVSLREVEPYTDAHQTGSDDESERRRFSKDDQRKRGSHKRRRREVGSGSRAAEVTKCAHVENEAEPIARQADDERTRQENWMRKVRAASQRDGRVNDSRHEAFKHGDLNRIGPRDLLSQVVVGCPAKARTCNRNWSG